MEIMNSVPKAFLKTYRKKDGGKVKKKDTKYLPLHLGFLKLEYGLYDNPDLLCLVSFVLDDLDDAIAVGPRLEMGLSPDEKNEEVTYISENGVSGLQWSGGEVIWGHTYDDDSGPGPGKKIALDEWIDEMIESMINPPRLEIDERRKLDSEDREYMKLVKKRKK